MPCATCTHDPRCADVCQHSSCATGQDGFNGDTPHLVNCMRALVNLNDAGALTPHGIGGHARTLLLAAASRLERVCEPETLTEAVAKVIYEQWKAAEGFVPWLDGGNSHKQDDARSLARKAIAGFRAPDVGKAQAPSLPIPRPTGEGLAGELWEGDDYGPTHEAALAEFACAVWERAAIAQSAPSPVLLEAGKEGK